MGDFLKREEKREQIKEQVKRTTLANELAVNGIIVLNIYTHIHDRAAANTTALKPETLEHSKKLVEHYETEYREVLTEMYKVQDGSGEAYNQMLDAQTDVIECLCEIPPHRWNELVPILRTMKVTTLDEIMSIKKEDIQ